MTSASIPGEFNANGIVKTRHGLVVGQSNTGLLFRVDKATGEATTIEGVSVPGADGIEPDHRTLYVTGNGVVTVVELARDALSGEVVDTLTSPDCSTSRPRPPGAPLAVGGQRPVRDPRPGERAVLADPDPGGRLRRPGPAQPVISSTRSATATSSRRCGSLPTGPRSRSSLLTR